MKYLIIKRKWLVSLTWTNWTFGFWYGRFSKNKAAWGIDIGPLELVYTLKS